MPDNIILIGMPGAGKSTVGVILAKTLGFDFYDVDILIALRQGKKLQEILDTHGISNFLQAEEFEALQISCEHTVIATGGSMVLSGRAMVHLNNLGRTIFLDVPFHELNRRLTNIKTRGIAAEKNASIEDIHRFRKPLYEKYAQIRLDCSEKSTEDIVAELSEILKIK